MSSYVAPTISERLTSAQTLCRQGYRELNEGQLKLASETFWRAAKKALKAEARRRGWDYESFSHLFHIAHRLTDETQNQQWLEWFNQVSELRADSIQQSMEASEIRNAGHIVDRLIRAILEMKRADDALSLGEWLNTEMPEDLRKEAFDQLLAGDLGAASDSYWAAMQLACRELAERLGWDPTSYTDERRLMMDIQREYCDDDQVRGLITNAQHIQYCASEGWYSESAIIGHDRHVRDLIQRLEMLPRKLTDP